MQQHAINQATHRLQYWCGIDLNYTGIWYYQFPSHSIGAKSNWHAKKGFVKILTVLEFKLVTTRKNHETG